MRDYSTALLTTAQDLQPHLVELYKYFHRNAEISQHEIKTSAKIIEELKSIEGIEVREHVAGYGVLAELHGAKPGKTVALRADIDALQITEDTGLPHSSETPGVMHGCGHDNHITALLGAAHILAKHRDQLCGSVRFIFQPAEELSPIGGARAMIAEGALEGVDAIFGLHVWPEIPTGTFGVKPGPFMATSDHFSVSIKGKGCHAGTPHMGADALVAAAQFINGVQTIVSRNTDPLKAAVVTLGKCSAGSRYNVVAENCELEGTCRTYNAEVRDMVERRLQEVLDGVCQLSNCTGVLNYERGYTAVVNEKDTTAYFMELAAEMFGNDQVIHVEQPSMGADDFSFFQLEVPGCFFWLGAKKENEPYWPLHNAHFAPDNQILWRGAAMLAGLAFFFE